MNKLYVVFQNGALETQILANIKASLPSKASS